MAARSKMDSREAILVAAKRTAQAHGYAGLNFRDLADDVGIRAASIYYHFRTKADLGAAVARRYCEDTQTYLETLSDHDADPIGGLRRYPQVFRISLEAGNRMCLCSFMAAEYDDLPAEVQKEVLAFADVNVAWLKRMLSAVTGSTPVDSEPRAKAIFAAVAGAQLVARSRSDISLFDLMVESYCAAGLIPVSEQYKSSKDHGIGTRHKRLRRKAAMS